MATNNLKAKIKVAVHNGIFHTDDVFAVAILSLFLEKPLKIFRTRDEKILAKMDYVLDVGLEYNPKKNKFDHHQQGWGLKRENGIPFATSGLVWKEFGEKISGSKENQKNIDEKIIQPIDAEDSGIEIYKNIFKNVNPYCLSDYISSFNPISSEKIDSLKNFKKMVEIVKEILKKEIKKNKEYFLDKKKIEKIYKKTKDKRILILDNYCSWKKTVDLYPEVLFVIHPHFSDNTWVIDTVKKPNKEFERKMYFPKSWAGKRDEELTRVTGTKDVIFCHNDVFIAITKTKEGAIALAKLAIKALYKIT